MTAALDLYYLFVENVFGSVLLTIIGFMVMFIIWGAITKQSPILLTAFVGLFLMVMFIGYIGGIAIIFFGIVAVYYFVSGLLNWISMRRG